MSAKDRDHADQILNHTLRATAWTSPTTIYVSLTTTVPTRTSAGTDLTVTQGRQTAAFAAPGAPSTGSGRACTNSGVISWSSWAAANNGETVVGFNVWDTASGTATGDRLYWGSLTTSRTLNTGETATFAIGALEIIED